MNGILVTIVNYEHYKGRKDVTHNSWFRCSNRLLEDPDFFGFTSDEILVWVYILSLSSQKDTDTVFINFDHAERVCRLSKEAVVGAVEKLRPKQLLPAAGTRPSRRRTVAVTEAGATDITNKQTNSKSGAEKSAPDLPLANPKNLIDCVPKEIQDTWPELYPEKGWVEREATKAVNWAKVNPKKAPKSSRGCARFFTGWLERGWERYRKSLPSTSSATGGWE